MPGEWNLLKRGYHRQFDNLTCCHGFWWNIKLGNFVQLSFTKAQGTLSCDIVKLPQGPWRNNYKISRRTASSSPLRQGCLDSERALAVLHCISSTVMLCFTLFHKFTGWNNWNWHVKSHIVGTKKEHHHFPVLFITSWKGHLRKQRPKKWMRRGIEFVSPFWKGSKWRSTVEVLWITKGDQHSAEITPTISRHAWLEEQNKVHYGAVLWIRIKNWLSLDFHMLQQIMVTLRLYYD